MFTSRNFLVTHMSTAPVLAENLKDEAFGHGKQFIQLFAMCSNFSAMASAGVVCL